MIALFFAFLHFAEGASQGEDTAKLSPIHKAVIDNDLSEVKALLGEGMDAEIPESHGYTALHLAAFRQREMVELLIANKANVNAKAKNGWTPLHAAVVGGHEDIIELLLTNRADVNTKSDAGETPLSCAVGLLTEGNNELNKVMPQLGLQGKLSLQRPGRNPVASIEVLLSHEADPNLKNKRGVTPLHMAAVAGATDIAKMLLKAGAKVDATENAGTTPLFSAAFLGRLGTVKLLLENHANINVQERAGATALHLAAMAGHSEVVKCLLDHGAKINCKTDDGRTPLTVAILSRHLEIAKLLRERGGKE